MDSNTDSDLLRQCPFDENHTVRSSRYEIHISKCKRVSNYILYYIILYYIMLYYYEEL